MPERPLLKKINLWRDAEKGFKTRFNAKVKDSAVERADVPDVLVQTKIKRGDRLQQARLRFYPSIDVDREKLFAGRMDGDISDAEDRLVAMGYRNNPTAYVEVTDKNGPDDGSYSRNFITETGGRFDIPRVNQQPSLFRRVKRQIHVTLYDVPDGVEFLAHEEQSAWLQPARHVVANDAEAEVGVRDFRDNWWDEFGEELGGRDDVQWDTAH